MFHRKWLLPVLVLSSILSIAILSCSAAAGLPNPFASPTPTATATFTPTVTPSPTPTLTPTATPLPTGMDTESQADGSTLFRDWDNKYEAVLPAEWVMIPMTKGDIDRLIDQVAGQDPEFAKVAQAFKAMGSDIIRAIGLNNDSRYVKGQYPTLVVVTAISDPVASSMPMDFVTAMIEDDVLRGSTDTTAEAKKNAHGVEVGIVQGSLKVVLPQGGSVRTKAKILAFQANKKLVMMEFITPTQFASEVLPAIDPVIDTIQLLKP